MQPQTASKPKKIHYISNQRSHLNFKSIMHNTTTIEIITDSDTDTDSDPAYEYEDNEGASNHESWDTFKKSLEDQEGVWSRDEDEYKVKSPFQIMQSIWSSSQSFLKSIPESSSSSSLSLSGSCCGEVLEDGVRRTLDFEEGCGRVVVKVLGKCECEGEGEEMEEMEETVAGSGEREEEVETLRGRVRYLEGRLKCLEWCNVQGGFKNDGGLEGERSAQEIGKNDEEERVDDHDGRIWADWFEEYKNIEEKIRLLNRMIAIFEQRVDREEEQVVALKNKVDQAVTYEEVLAQKIERLNCQKKDTMKKLVTGIHDANRTRSLLRGMNIEDE